MHSTMLRLNPGDSCSRETLSWRIRLIGGLLVLLIGLGACSTNSGCSNYCSAIEDEQRAIKNFFTRKCGC